MHNVPMLLCAGVGVLCLVAAAAMIVCRVRYRINIFWGLISVIFCGAALLVCVVGFHAGTVYARLDGDPQAVTDQFFQSVIARDYDTAYSLLRDHSDLGLEVVPASEAGAEAYEALLESFDYKLVGDCEVELLSAKQKVSMRYLDLTSISSAVRTETMDCLKEIVQSRDRDEVYDENSQYLPQVTEEAYISAVAAVMDQAESYYVTVEFEMPLEYTNGKWMLETTPELLTALTGGTIS